jgi:hypothetical protein
MKDDASARASEARGAGVPKEGAMSKRSMRFVVSAVTVALIAGLVPPRAEADWDDQSGGLGTTSTKTMVIIGSAAAAGVVTLYLLKRKAARKTQPAPDPAADQQQGKTTSARTRGGFAEGARWPAGLAPDDVVQGLRADPRFAGLFQSGARSRAIAAHDPTAE